MGKRTAELSGVEPTCPGPGRHSCNNATGTVVQTHYPGTWFVDKYASPGVSLSTKDRCSGEESHGRISISVGQARQASRRVSGKSPGQLSSQTEFKNHTVQCSRPQQRHSTPSIYSASYPSTQSVCLSASSPHSRLPLVCNCGLCRPIPSRSPSRDTNSIDLAAASAAFHAR